MYRTWVDGGYLSWVYGTTPGFGNWNTVWREYRQTQIILDSPKLWRAEIDAGYKIERAIRREQDDRIWGRFYLVRSFRRQLVRSGLVPVYLFPGYEADDILALAVLKGLVDRLVSLDKDLYQIPGAREMMVDISGESIEPETRLKRKFPKYLHSFMKQTGPQYVWLQAVYGDKSDSVPRLLDSSPKKAQGQVEMSWKYGASGAFDIGVTLWGISFLSNLKLVTLPALGLSLKAKEYQEDAEAYLRDLQTGQYWAPENWQDLEKTLEEYRYEELLPEEEAEEGEDGLQQLRDPLLRAPDRQGSTSDPAGSEW